MIHPFSMPVINRSSLQMEGRTPSGFDVWTNKKGAQITLGALIVIAISYRFCM